MASFRNIPLPGLLLTVLLLCSIVLASPSRPLTPREEITEEKSDENKPANVDDVTEKLRSFEPDRQGGVPADLSRQVTHNASGAEVSPENREISGRRKREPEPGKRKFKVYPLLCG